MGMPRRYNAVAGQKFNDFTFIKECKSPGVERLWLCACKCGLKRKLVPRNVARGDWKRCKRCASSRPRNRKSKFECVGDRYIQSLWRRTHRGMLERCYDKNHHAYKNYGARGIEVHSSLIDPESFARFIITLEGWNDDGLSLDRIDNDGDYAPGNLRMATAKQQTQNRRPKYRWGETTTGATP